MSQLARATGTQRQHIQQIESGKVKEPNAYILDRIARQLQIDSRTLLYGVSESGGNALSESPPVLRRQDSVIEILLPYSLHLSDREWDELARRVAFEVTLLRERRPPGTVDVEGTK